MSFINKIITSGKKQGGIIGKDILEDKVVYGFAITFFTLLGVWVNDITLFPFSYVLNIGYIFAIISVGSGIEKVGKRRYDLNLAMEREDRKARRDKDKFESYFRMKIIGSKAKIQTYAATSILGNIDENESPKVVSTLVKIANTAMVRVDKLIDEIFTPWEKWVLERYTPEVEKEIKASDMPLPTAESNQKLKTTAEDLKL